MQPVTEAPSDSPGNDVSLAAAAAATDVEAADLLDQATRLALKQAAVLGGKIDVDELTADLLQLTIQDTSPEAAGAPADLSAGAGGVAGASRSAAGAVGPSTAAARPSSPHKFAAASTGHHIGGHDQAGAAHSQAAAARINSTKSGANTGARSLLDELLDMAIILPGQPMPAAAAGSSTVRDKSLSSRGVWGSYAVLFLERADIWSIAVSHHAIDNAQQQ